MHKYSDVFDEQLKKLLLTRLRLQINYFGIFGNMVQKKEIQGGGSFKSHKTYSPQEILAAGGTTIFGRQTKKNNASLVEVLAKTPAIEPFTDKEWENLQEQLDGNK